MRWTERFSAPVRLSHPIAIGACVGIGAVVLIAQCLVLAPADALAGLILVPLLLWASAVDLERHILPNALVIPLILAGLVRAGLGAMPLIDACVGAGLGYLLLAGVMWAYRAQTGRDGLGLGDAKLFAAAGAWIGWSGLPSVMLIASLLALASYGVGYVSGDREWRHRAIAFGPYIAVAMWVVWAFRLGI